MNFASWQCAAQRVIESLEGAQSVAQQRFCAHEVRFKPLTLGVQQIQTGQQLISLRHARAEGRQLVSGASRELARPRLITLAQVPGQPHRRRCVLVNLSHGRQGGFKTLDRGMVLKQAHEWVWQ